MVTKFNINSIEDIDKVTYLLKYFALDVGFVAYEASELITAVSEATTNAIRYANNCVVTVIYDENEDCIKVTVKDSGDGILDLQKALKDGFSSSENSLGVGFGAMNRLVDDFKIVQNDLDGVSIILIKYKGRDSSMINIMDTKKPNNKDKELLTLYQYLDAIMTNIPYGIFTLSEDLEVLMLNSTVLSLLNLDKIELESFIDKTYKKLFIKIPEIIDIFESNISKQQYEFDIKKIVVDDKVLNIKVYSMLDGLLVIIEDYTLQAEYESKLEDLNSNLQKLVDQKVEENLKQQQLLFQQSKLASMGEMIGNIAHQWRQPLNALSMTNSSVVMKFKHNKLTDKDIDNFKEKSEYLIKKMSTTIDDFRNFFNPNKTVVEFKLSKVVDDVIKFLDSSFMDNSIKLKVEFDKNLTIYGYPSELIQVLLVVLNNSKDAFKERNIKDRHIVLKAKQQDSLTTITIEDNAGGIDEKILHRVCEPYFTTKFGSDGTGIGLYMAKMIIEKSMNGRFYIQNSNDGVLTTIEINNKEEQ